MDNIRFYFNDKKAIEETLLQLQPYQAKYCSELNEIIYPIKFKLGNLIVVITETSAYLENSLHKFYNAIISGEAINHNDFPFRDFSKAIDELEKMLQYDLSDTKITTLELAFNLETNKSASYIIAKNIMLYKFKGDVQKENTSKMCLKRFKLGFHKWKIYDKAKHCRLPYHLLRMEVVYKSKELERLNIINVRDLTSPTIQKKLFKDYMDKFEQLEIVDTRFQYRFTQQEKEKIGNFLEPTYWDQKFRYPKAKTRAKQSFHKLIKDLNLLSVKDQLRQLLLEKFNELY